MEAIIRTEHLCKTYGEGEAKVEALKDVSVSFEKGKMTAIIGASGSGKTTLMHIIGGLDSLAQGKAFLEDRDLLQLKDKELAQLRAEKIGFVFQFFKLIPELSARENILFPAMIIQKKPEQSCFERLCENLGVSDRLKHYPSQLSGGQQQRVAIARALINQPDVILCDEPTGNLDEQSGEEVMQLLEKLCRESGKTIIIVTHDMQIAQKCDKVIRIADGRIAESDLKNRAKEECQ